MQSEHATFIFLSRLAGEEEEEEGVKVGRLFRTWLKDSV